MIKFLMPLALATFVFANNDLNQYFNNNNIAITCENNQCNGNNVKFNSISFDSISFKLKDDFKFKEKENTQAFNDYCLQQTNDENKCNKIVKEMMFTNLLTAFSIDGSISIKNGVFNTLSFDNLNTNNNLPIFNVFNDKNEIKKITFKDLISNKIDANVTNLKSDFNDFEVFLNYVDSDLKELNDIPKEHWNDEVANAVEFNLNLRYILNKFNIYLNKNNIKKNLSLTLTPIDDKKTNTLFYTLNLKITDELKDYEMFFKLSLKDIKGISKNFDKINNKEIALALLLPSLNFNELNITLKNDKMNELHNKFLIEDIKYQKAYNSLDFNGTIDSKDKSIKKINIFINNFLSMKNNNHIINIKNPNNKEFIKLLTNIIDNKEPDFESFLNSLNIEFKNF